MFKRLKTAWRLSNISELQEADYIYTSKDSKVEPLAILVEGDGKAEFLGEGSAEEFEEQTKKDKGLWGLFGTKK